MAADMTSRPRKRRKRNINTDGDSAPAQSIAKVSKEELELEEQLFGRTLAIGDNTNETVLAPRRKRSKKGQNAQQNLGELADDQLFFVDAPRAQPQDTSGDDLESVTPGSKLASALVKYSKPRSLPKAEESLWHDPADDVLRVSLCDNKRLRKLRKTAQEDVVHGAEYEQRLRQQFEKFHPAPNWAKPSKARKAEISDSGAESISQITSSRTSPLKGGEIHLQRLRNIGQEVLSKTSIQSLEFHPNAQVMYTATSDKKIRLFQIDGLQNPVLQTIHLPELPFKSTRYHPSGDSILITGPRPFYYTYDLQTGQVTRSNPRGLWNRGNVQQDGFGTIDHFEFSHHGKFVAFTGRNGQIRLLDWTSLNDPGGGQVIAELKTNAPIVGLSWSADDSQLLSVTKDAEVYVWDVRQRACVARWRDQGGFGTCSVSGDSRADYLTVGSTSGIVNLYDSRTALEQSINSSSVNTFAERAPLRSIMNLTTTISSMRFNHDSQILALASSDERDQLKLFHLGSQTVFSNWPTSGTPLGRVTTVDFSRQSEYLAIGNDGGKVLLYSLDHYNGR